MKLLALESPDLRSGELAYLFTREVYIGILFEFTKSGIIILSITDIDIKIGRNENLRAGFVDLHSLPPSRRASESRVLAIELKSLVAGHLPFQSAPALLIHPLNPGTSGLRPIGLRSRG